MKIYHSLMEDHEVSLEYWPLYADVECNHCDKNQSLAAYRSNGSCCVKCGEKIEV